MSDLVLELKARVMSLSPVERSQLFDLLVRSLDEDAAVADTWANEALRREAEVKAGEVDMLDAMDALQRIESELL